MQVKISACFNRATSSLTIGSMTEFGPYYADLLLKTDSDDYVQVFQVLRDPIAIYQQINNKLRVWGEYVTEDDADVDNEDEKKNSVTKTMVDTVTKENSKLKDMFDIGANNDGTATVCVAGEDDEDTAERVEADAKNAFWATLHDDPNALATAVVRVKALSQKVQEIYDGIISSSKSFDVSDVYMEHTAIFLKGDSSAELMRFAVIADGGPYRNMVEDWQRVVNANKYNMSFESLLSKAMNWYMFSDQGFCCGFEYIAAMRVPTRRLKGLLKQFAATYGVEIAATGTMFDCKQKRTTASRPTQADRLVSWLTSMHVGTNFRSNATSKLVSLETASEGGGKKHTVLAAKTINRFWCGYSSERNDDTLDIKSCARTRLMRYMESNGWLANVIGDKAKAIDAKVVMHHIQAPIVVAASNVPQLGCYNFVQNMFCEMQKTRHKVMADVLSVYSVSNFDYNVLSNLGLCTAMLKCLWNKSQTAPFMYDAHQEIHFTRHKQDDAIDQMSGNGASTRHVTYTNDSRSQAYHAEQLLPLLECCANAAHYKDEYKKTLDRARLRTLRDKCTWLTGNLPQFLNGESDVASCDAFDISTLLDTSGLHAYYHAHRRGYCATPLSFDNGLVEDKPAAKKIICAKLFVYPRCLEMCTFQSRAAAVTPAAAAIVDDEPVANAAPTIFYPFF